MGLDDDASETEKQNTNVSKQSGFAQTQDNIMDDFDIDLR